MRTGGHVHLVSTVGCGTVAQRFCNPLLASERDCCGLGVPARSSTHASFEPNGNSCQNLGEAVAASLRGTVACVGMTIAGDGGCIHRKVLAVIVAEHHNDTVYLGWTMVIWSGAVLLVFLAESMQRPVTLLDRPA